MPRIDFLPDLLNPHRLASHELCETKPLMLHAERRVIAIIAPHPRLVSRSGGSINEESCHTLNRALQDRKRPPPLELNSHKVPSMYLLSSRSEERLIPASPAIPRSRSRSPSISHGSSVLSTPSPTSMPHAFQSPPSPLRQTTASSYLARELDTVSRETLSLSSENTDESLVTLGVDLTILKRRRSIVGSRGRSITAASRPTPLASLTGLRIIASSSVSAQRSSIGDTSAEAAKRPDPFARNGFSFLPPRRAIMGDIYDIAAYTDPSQGYKEPVHEPWAPDIRSRASVDHRPVRPGKENMLNVPTSPKNAAGVSAQRGGLARPRAQTLSAPSPPRDVRVRNARSLPPKPDEPFSDGIRGDASKPPAPRQTRLTPGHVGRDFRANLETRSLLSQQVDELMALIDAY